MRSIEHSNDPHVMIIDGRDVSEDGAKLDTIQAGAQVNNLTDVQALSLTSGLSCNWHTHDDFYYTITQLQTSGSSSINWNNITSLPSSFPPNIHTHDDRYYIKSEIDSSFYTKTLLDSGQLDSRYYTESEIDSKLVNKLDKISSPIAGNFVIQNSDGSLSSSLISSSTFALSSHNHSSSDIISGIFGIDRGGTNNSSYTLSNFLAFDGTKIASTSYNSLSFSPVDHTHTMSQIINFLDSDYVHTSSNEVINGDKTFSGNITIQGNLTTVSSSDLSVSDNEIILNNGESGEGISKGYSGISISRGTLDSAILRFDEADDSWKIGVGTSLLKISTSDHIHDDRYYTEAEIDNKLTLKSDLTHLHDDRYYTKILLDAGQLDNRYYTESEVNSLLALKSDLTHLHDDRYYTETEIDNKLVLKSDLTHLHDDRYFTETEIDNKLALKSDLTHLHDDRYFTETEINASFYTKTNVDTIISSYYTKSQLDAGQLDSRYYIKTLLDNGQLDSRYYTETETNNLFYTKSQLDAGQLDSRYYTESEIGSSTGAAKIGITQISGMSSSNVQQAFEEIHSVLIGSGALATLNGAYTNGNSISIVNSPVKIDSNSSTSAPLELTNRSTVPSTNLIAGQIVVVDNELYIYDGNRSKWLSSSKVLTFGKKGNVDGSLLESAGGCTSTSSGYRMNKSGTITGVSINTTSAVDKVIYIRINSNNSQLLNAIGGYLIDNTLNLDFAANDVISVYADSAGSAVTDITCVIEFRWKR